MTDHERDYLMGCTARYCDVSARIGDPVARRIAEERLKVLVETHGAECVARWLSENERGGGYTSTPIQEGQAA